MTRPNEQRPVEQRLIDQLLALRWNEWIAGDLDVPYLTERESFREVLLVGRLRDAVRRINVCENGHQTILGLIEHRPFSIPSRR